MAKREKHLCPICGRYHISDHMSYHHLYPTVNNKQKEEDEVIYICNTCHSVIHYCHSNQELRYIYNTLEAILQSETILDMVDLYKYKSDNCVFKIKKLKNMIKCCA